MTELTWMPASVCPVRGFVRSSPPAQARKNPPWHTSTHQRGAWEAQRGPQAEHICDLQRYGPAGATWRSERASVLQTACKSAAVTLRRALRARCGMRQVEPNVTVPDDVRGGVVDWLRFVMGAMCALYVLLMLGIERKSAECEDEGQGNTELQVALLLQPLCPSLLPPCVLAELAHASVCQ